MPDTWQAGDPQPTDITRVWDRHGGCWEREASAWTAWTNDGLLLVWGWHHLTQERGPVTAQPSATPTTQSRRDGVLDRIASMITRHKALRFTFAVVAWPFVALADRIAGIDPPARATHEPTE